MSTLLRIAILLAGAAVVAGCSAVAWNTPGSARDSAVPTLPDKHLLARDQLLFHSDFALPEKHRLLDELMARRADVGLALGLPVSSEPIHVYLFEDNDRFRAFMRGQHPEFPGRRAFFVETDTRLIVYAHWGDRVAEDLRHEITHGYVHSVVPELPPWLDEGLAEYFEVRRGENGLSRAHVERLAARLRNNAWQPDLARLEQIGSRAALDMTQDDYAESWAWVHFLLRSRPEHAGLLHAYLAELRRDGSAAPLSARLTAMLRRPDVALVEHVRWLAARSSGGSRPADL